MKKLGTADAGTLCGTRTDTTKIISDNNGKIMFTERSRCIIMITVSSFNQLALC